MRIETRAQVDVARQPQEVFDFAAACESFPRVLLPRWPIPGVTGAAMRDGADPRPGALRMIQLSDGSTVEEELLAFERPLRHAYRWTRPPAPPLGWLVRGGEGDWSFGASGAGTRIVWVYRFELRSALAHPFAVAVVPLFRRWMSSGLVRIREVLEGR